MNTEETIKFFQKSISKIVINLKFSFGNLHVHLYFSFFYYSCISCIIFFWDNFFDKGTNQNIMAVGSTHRILGRRMLLIPPSLTLILRQRLDRVWGVVLFTFLAWTHCVANPNKMSPTRFTSAVIQNKCMRNTVHVNRNWLYITKLFKTYIWHYGRNLVTLDPFLPTPDLPYTGVFPGSTTTMSWRPW